VVVVAIGLAYLALWLSIALAPGPMTDFAGDHANPLGWRSAESALRAIGAVGFGLLGAAAVATVASVGWRYRRGDPEVRSQLRWLVVTVAVIAVTLGVPPVPHALAGVVLGLNVLATVLLPVALGVALVRRDGLVLPRVLLYGFLSVLLLTAYLTVVGVADALFGSRAVSSW